MDFIRTTEIESKYHNLEHMSTFEILKSIHAEDRKVPAAVAQAIPQIEALVIQIVKKLKKGGRLFYMGAGTSGRLGIVDASECPPTFGVAQDLVIGLIAGGDQAIRKAVEFAEDSPEQGWRDLTQHQVSTNDVVIGIAASGTTPYVVHAIKKCNAAQILTAGISCNEGSPLATIAQHPIVITVGPEFITGSSRMKAGTAQKLVLNMISTATMIQLGRVKGNKMVDMQLSNTKLVDRAIRMLMEILQIDQQKAEVLLATHKSVRIAIAEYENQKNK